MPSTPHCHCQMIKAPKAQQPLEHAGTATLSALHQYRLAILPGCNLWSFTLLIVTLDLVTVADLFVKLFYPLCEGHVISPPEKANALHFLQICLMKTYLSAVPKTLHTFICNFFINTPLLNALFHTPNISQR